MQKKSTDDEDIRDETEEEGFEEEELPELKGILYQKPEAVHFHIVLQIFLLWF